MFITTPRARAASRRRPFNPGRRHRADFARAAVFAEFGRNAFAIDQADFEDRRPQTMPAHSPEARFR